MVGGGGSDVEDEAQPGFVGGGVADATGFAGVFEGGDDGPPLEVLEAQMRAELAQRGDFRALSGGGGGVRGGAADDDDAEGPGGKGTPLPDLDALVARLPADVRDTLDELFRARFVSVKKLPKKAFQAASSKAPPAAS